MTLHSHDWAVVHIALLLNRSKLTSYGTLMNSPVQTKTFDWVRNNKNIYRRKRPSSLSLINLRKKWLKRMSQKNWAKLNPPSSIFSAPGIKVSSLNIWHLWDSTQNRRRDNQVLIVYCWLLTKNFKAQKNLW